MKKVLSRRTVRPFLHYRKPVVVTLVPGDVIQLRLLGQRDTSSVSIAVQDLYYELMRREVARRKREKKQRRRK